MSTSLFAVQTSLGLLTRPKLHDLYTITLNGSDMWYKLGLELGLEVNTVERIKLENSNSQTSKRAMFKEWLELGTCCTWQRLVQALEQVDQTVAKTVLETVAIEYEQPPAIERPTKLKTSLPLHRSEGTRTMKRDIDSRSVHEKPLTSVRQFRTSHPATECNGMRRHSLYDQSADMNSSLMSKSIHSNVETCTINHIYDSTLATMQPRKRKESLSEQKKAFEDASPAIPTTSQDQDFQQHRFDDQEINQESISADTYQTASEYEDEPITGHLHNGETSQQQRHIQVRPSRARKEVSSWFA